jgi:hypothetical protein
MASVSKQFTAFSIVLLELAGKLRLDDDVRKYLPWFPDLGSKITIRNLLSHTSGIRDQWTLLAIQGTRMQDVITQHQIVKILQQQQLLMKDSTSRYAMFDERDIQFTLEPLGKDTGVYIKAPGEGFRVIKYTPVSEKDERVLQAYVGDYYCPELGCT